MRFWQALHALLLGPHVGTATEVLTPQPRRMEPSGPLVSYLDEWIHGIQHEALKSFFAATQMDSDHSRHLHNWFNGSDHYCNFTGVGCDQYGYVTILDLNETGLAGTLPDLFGDLPRLTRLRVHNNSIGGSIPTSLTRMSELRHLNLGHNFFVGTFPDFSEASLLERLIMDRNGFSGSLPGSLCKLRHLDALDLAGSTKLSGGLPDCLGDLTALTKLRITDMGLTGTIPSALCGEREMNGLLPNAYGCAGIGCEAGTFQRAGGRQSSDDTACEPCLVPSNVIGGSICQWVHTEGDPGSSNFYPAAVLSSSPSVAPTKESASDTPSPTPTVDLALGSLPNVPTPSGSLASFTAWPSEMVPPLPTLEPLSPVNQKSQPLPTLASEPSFQPSSVDPLDTINGIAQEPDLSSDSQKGGIIAGSVLACAAAFSIVGGALLWMRRPRRVELQQTKDKLEDLEAGPENDTVTLDPENVHSDAQHAPAGNHAFDMPPIYTIKEERSIEDSSPAKAQSSIMKPAARHSPSINAEAPGRRVRFTLPEPIQWSSDEESQKDKGEAQNRQDEEANSSTTEDFLVDDDAEAWVSWIMNPLFDTTGLCSSQCHAPNVDDNDGIVASPSTESSANSTTPILPEKEVSSDLYFCFETASRQEDIASVREGSSVQEIQDRSGEDDSSVVGDDESGNVNSREPNSVEPRTSATSADNQISDERQATDAVIREDTYHDKEDWAHFDTEKQEYQRNSSEAKDIDDLSEYGTDLVEI